MIPAISSGERGYQRDARLILVMRGVHSFAYGLPFILAGTLKAAYDCSLWMIFHWVELEIIGNDYPIVAQLSA